MFRVVATILTVKNGKMSAEITLSGIGYDYLYMGTAAEAAGNESQRIGCKDEQKSYIENGEEKAFMMRAFDNANRAVYEKATSDPEVLGMGTTGVCALQRGNLAHIVHAGDSRAYLWHGGAIRQLTRDHSMVQQLVDSGQITREQAALHPQKNLITRALGVSANIVPEYNRCEVVPGDLLLLCTDGLTNMVPDAELALLLQESAFFDAPGVLVDRALKGGGQDNITVLLLGVETTEETNG